MQTNRYLLPIITLFLLFTATACETSNSSGPDLSGETKTYQLDTRSESGVSGTALFEELEDGSTQITLQLNGTPSNGTHPAHIHLNSAAEGGDIIISLQSIEGSSGNSVTTVETTDSGDRITYDQLMMVDAYINVHQSSDDLATVIAQGDVGANELTGETKQYMLEERNTSGVSGSVTFAQRMDGTTLATLSLDGTPQDGNHPAHIHMNSASEGGDIAVTFSTVNGATGMSQTQIEQTDGGDALTYSDILNYDGYVNVHLSANDLTVVAQGDIGANELTGESQSYTLGERNTSGVSGSVTFNERVDGTALAIIAVTGTASGNMHPAHIHNNSASEGGPIAVTFTPVDGATGMSSTQIEGTDGGEELGYSDLLGYDGYVNVHLSADDLTVISQGNIGANAGN